MLKKTTLAIAAAAALSMAALAPSTASAKTSFHFNAGFYGPGYGWNAPHYGYRYGYRGYRRCHYHTRKVWTKYGPRWRKIRHCRRHYNPYY